MVETMTKTETTETTEPKYRLTIIHDDYPHGAPDENDNLFKLHSFNRNHGHFTDPDVVLGCKECGETKNVWVHSDANLEDDGEWKYLTWANEQREEQPEEVHEYVGPEGFPLSYFEHGLCRWGLQGTMSGTPDFRWDGVSFGGFLEVEVDRANEEWWNGKTIEERTEIASSFLEEFTNWANGEVYGYEIERINQNPQVCNLGHTHVEEDTEIDSCWGFIGFDWLQEAVREALPDDATEDNTQIVDRAHGATAYAEFFVEGSPE